MQRLRNDCGQQHGLPGQQVHFAEESRRAMADEFLPASVNDCHLPFANCDEGIGRISDAKEHIADIRGELLADSRERR
jgi:hypothetical protein